MKIEMQNALRNEVDGPGGRPAEEVPRHDLVAVGEYDNPKRHRTDAPD